MENEQPAGSNIRYLRLAITNGNGKRSAEDVEVLVMNVDGGPPGGATRRWLVNPALRWPNLRPEQPPQVTVPPGATRYVDLGRWQRDGASQLPRFLFVLALDMPPKSEEHVLEPGSYTIRLAV